MNTLNTTVGSHVPTDDTNDGRNVIQDSKAPLEIWVLVVPLLLLSIGGLYLVWAKVSGAWPFSH